MNVILDECFQFGLGAFETIGIEQGAPILLEKHLKRLERAAVFLNLGDLAERGITVQKIIKYLEEQKAHDAQIQLQIEADAAANSEAQAAAEPTAQILNSDAKFEDEHDSRNNER